MERERKYPREEYARMGQEWYRKLLPTIEEGNHGKYVAIDIETGEFEIGEDMERTTAQLHARMPEAWIWLERVGYAAPVKLGWRFRGIKLC